MITLFSISIIIFLRHMDSLNKQIEMLEKEHTYYEETINLRKKQFHTLLVSADEILYSIKQNREGKEYEWIKALDELTEDLTQDDETDTDDNEDDKEDGILEDKGIYNYKKIYNLFNMKYNFEIIKT